MEQYSTTRLQGKIFTTSVLIKKYGRGRKSLSYTLFPILKNTHIMSFHSYEICIYITACH